MRLAARVSVISSAHSSTLCKNAPKSCICHRSAKSPSKFFICHTSKNALPQVLCLPHLRVPPGGPASPFPLSSQFGTRFCRFQIRVQPDCPSTLAPCSCRSRVGGFFWFHRHQSPVTCFKSFSASEGFYFPVVSREENRLCYTDPVSRKLAW